MVPTRLGFDRMPRIAARAVILAVGMLSILTAGCSSQPADLEAISDPLMAPIPQAPPDGRVYRFPPAGQPPLVLFEWRHGMPTAQVPSPHQAERIIVCVYDEQRGECESGTREGVPKPIWFDAAADDPAIQRTPIEPEKIPFVSSPEIHLGYEFRTGLPMRPEYRGRSLSWQVGACLGGTCRMSDPRSLRMDSPGERDQGIGSGF